MSAVSSKPSDDHNDGADRDIQTYQPFPDLHLFLSSTEVQMVAQSRHVSTIFTQILCYHSKPQHHKNLKKTVVNDIKQNLALTHQPLGNLSPTQKLPPNL